MLPPPPDLLTTLSVDGMSLLVTRMRSTVRSVLSLLPPGALGTTSSTFFCGAHDCAAPAALNAASTAAATIRFNAMVFCLIETELSGKGSKTKVTRAASYYLSPDSAQNKPTPAMPHHINLQHPTHTALRRLTLLTS